MVGKGRLVICVCMTIGLTLTGCSGNSMYTAARDREKWAAEAAEAAASEEESALQYLTDDSDEEDYLTLAQQYAELGTVRRQRDILEQSYRLFGSEDTLEQLSTLWVDLAEEETGIQEMADLMLQNMEQDEYRTECLRIAAGADWFETMMPKLRTGCRNYFQQTDGEVRLAITVGYTDEEAQYSCIWYLDAEGRDYYLSYDGQTALLVEAEESLTAGAFTLWSFDGLTGDIQRENGTLADGALDLTVEYHILRFEGTGKSDICDMMDQRENVEYEELDSYGGAAGQSRLSEVQAVPEITVYEPTDIEELTASDIEIRVCDGELQWLSEDGWISLGTLEELAESDQFRAYAEEKAQYDEAIRNAQAQAEAEPETEETTETEENTEESQAAAASGTTQPTQSATTHTTETQTTPSSEAAASTQAAEQTGNTADSSENNNDNNDSSNDNAGAENTETENTGTENTGTENTETENAGTTDAGTTDAGTTATAITNTDNENTNTDTAVDTEEERRQQEEMERNEEENSQGEAVIE